MSVASRIKDRFISLAQASFLDARARTALWLTLGGIPIVIILTVWLIMGQAAAQSRMAEALESAGRTQLLIEHARATLIGIETGQRGFLLTDEEDYLEPYREGRASLSDLATHLTQAMSDDRAQSGRLVELASVTGRKLDELSMTLTLHRQGDPGAALDLVREGKGRRLMVEIQSILDEMAALERSNAEAARAAIAVIDRRIHTVLVVGGLILFLLSVAASLIGGRALHLANISRQEAEMANRTKTTFLAMMSHELRTPMNGVLGMAHLLEQSDLTEVQAERVRTIRTCGEGLMVVLNDILDISKIEADKFELDTTDFDIMEVVGHALDMWRPSAEMKDLFLDLKVSGDVQSRVSGDPNRLRQILANLLSNAVKFTVMGGVYVRVHVEPLNKSQRTVKIVVADTGPGVPIQAQKRLFQPFVQADSSVTREFGGTGLGLAISRRLARMMGGDITLVSEKGAGAAFTFVGVFGAAKSAAPPPAAPAEEPTSIAGLKILAAEDNPHNQVVLRGLLEAVGCNVHLVGDGQAALEAYDACEFDLILMDIQMPVLDGVGALNHIRRLPGARGRIPVIALTANAKVGDRETYLDAGFDDHIPKPIEPRAFVDAIGRVMARSRSEAAQRATAREAALRRHLMNMAKDD